MISKVGFQAARCWSSVDLKQLQVRRKSVMKKFIVFAACMILGFSSLSQADENRFRQFNSDVDTAYAEYRKALFQTNQKNAEKSAKTNSLFQEQWKKIIAAYGSQPPEVFSSDPKWHETLTEIDRIAEKSSALIAAGQLVEAHEHLEGIRDQLSQLRKRNSVIVFSDHINNYHEVMEGLLEGGYTPDKIDESAMNEIRGHLSVLKYLAEAIKINSPAHYKDNESYRQLQKGLFASLDALDKAVAAQNSEAIAKSIKMLKPAYAKLFVNFG